MVGRGEVSKEGQGRLGVGAGWTCRGCGDSLAACMAGVEIKGRKGWVW